QNDPMDNFMDYSLCSVTFTEGQSERMYDAIENLRFSLLESRGCASPCIASIRAGFTTPADTVVLGDNLSFTNTSTNATNFDWKIAGTSFSGNSYTFDALGTFDVSLTVTNNDPNCTDVFTKSITVICPAQADFTISNTTPGIDEPVNFGNTSVGANSFSWKVNDEAPVNTTDFSFASDTPGIYRICLIATAGSCETTNCQNILVEFSGDCIDPNIACEICNNGIDDDGDGLVDFYDDDCPCVDPNLCGAPYFSNCVVDCDATVPDAAFAMNGGQYATEVFKFNNIMVAADVDGDCITDLITLSGAGRPLLAVIDGQAKILKYSANANNEEYGFMCSGDVDQDGQAEIFIIWSNASTSEWFVARYDFNAGINNIEQTWIS
ncbi:MAG: hypothetical protein AAFO94_21100, partial [Bacteroidota bacterium]